MDQRSIVGLNTLSGDGIYLQYSIFARNAYVACLCNGTLSCSPKEKGGFMMLQQKFWVRGFRKKKRLMVNGYLFCFCPVNIGSFAGYINKCQMFCINHYSV